MAKGAPKPTTTPELAISSQTRAAAAVELTHKAPVPNSEEPGHGVEGDVAARALGVVVWAGELSAGRVEATAGDGVGRRGHAHGGPGEHLKQTGSTSSSRIDVKWSDVL